MIRFLLAAFLPTVAASAEWSAKVADASRMLRALEADFHYHRWVDNPHEGGLKPGLRTLRSPGKPLGDRKLAWTVYAALGTPREAEATAFSGEILPGAEKPAP